MLASPSSSQTCLPFIPLNGMPLLPAHARHSAPPISLRSFRWRQQASVTCMAAQPQKSNFETRWAARQRDWRTQLAQLQRRIRESQAVQQLVVLLQPLIRVHQALLALLQREEERYWEFVEQETMRHWEWQNETEKHRGWWVNLRTAVNNVVDRVR